MLDSFVTITNVRVYDSANLAGQTVHNYVCEFTDGTHENLFQTISERTDSMDIFVTNLIGKTRNEALKYMICAHPGSFKLTNK